MSRTDQYIITLTRSRDGKDFGKWQTFQGGGVDSAETTTRDGYGLPRKQLGGPATQDVITCARVFYPDTDNGQLGELKGDAGHTEYVANKQKLDPDGLAIGAPEAFNCMLKSCKPSDVNVADDTPSADTYTIELSVEG
jgi:hypothetical protein